MLELRRPMQGLRLAYLGSQLSGHQAVANDLASFFLYRKRQSALKLVSEFLGLSVSVGDNE